MDLQTEITITRWNIIALAGWFIILLSLIGLSLHVFFNIRTGVWFGVVGICCGLFMVTQTGPIKTMETKKISLNKIEPK